MAPPVCFAAGTQTPESFMPSVEYSKQAFVIRAPCTEYYLADSYLPVSLYATPPFHRSLKGIT